MLGRVIAVLLLLVGIVGIGISIVGVMFGFQVVDALGEALDDTLALTSESLTTVTETLELTKQSVGQTGQAIGTVSDTTDSVAQLLVDTQPLLDDVSQVATADVPGSLEAVQGAVPNLVAVAGAVDNALETLSRFEFEQSILGVSFGFDLGIDYAPEEPFDASVAQIGESLEGVPENLRGLQVHLDTANDNLANVSDNMQTLTEDLAAIEGSVEDVGPLLDDYISLVARIDSDIARTRANINDQLQTVKTGIIILFVWFGLNQLVPLYLGFDLITDGRLGSRPGLKGDRPNESAGSEETAAPEENQSDEEEA